MNGYGRGSNGHGPTTVTSPLLGPNISKVPEISVSKMPSLLTMTTKDDRSHDIIQSMVSNHDDIIVANSSPSKAYKDNIIRRGIGDGSWELRVLVTDLQVERTIRVHGDLHIGGLMIKLVDELDIAMDWSDHAMWWPEKNIWLDKTRWTLDQYNLTADAVVHFTPMHKTIRIQLPDLRYVDLTVDFSVRTFNAVINLCKELEIRHPEELSLCKPIDLEHLKFNYGEYRRQEEKRRRITLGSMGSHSSHTNGHYKSSRQISASMAEVDRIAPNDRPDTNTFIGNHSLASASSTLGRKISTLSWNGGGNRSSSPQNLSNTPVSRFRSLGRITGSHSHKNGHNGLHNGSSITIEHPTPPPPAASSHHFNSLSVPPMRRRRSECNTPINGTWKSNGSGYSINGFGHSNYGSEWSLAMSPPPSQEAKYSIIRPKNLAQRARMNVAWLDSSLSIMEQGIRDFDTLLLRWKFHAFYDLNPKTGNIQTSFINHNGNGTLSSGTYPSLNNTTGAQNDHVRINLIYEQAKWQLLNEEIDCTEEEMMLFAALQLQVGLQANVPQPYDDDEEGAENNTTADDIEAALTDLQLSLEATAAACDVSSPPVVTPGNRNGSINGHNGTNGFEDITSVPSLAADLRYLRPKKFTIKGYKRHHFVLKDLQLAAYRDVRDYEAMGGGAPAFIVCLKGCEVAPDINIANSKYGIHLSVPSADGMSDLWLKCDSEQQYARWMAACRMAAKGKTMADRGYDAEVKSIQAFLSMQHPVSQPVINPATLDIQVEEYVAPRFLRKMKSRLRHKILEAHVNVKDLNLLEAKMNFIKAWQSLPDYGVSLFVVRFHGEKREELLGVAFNRIMRMSLQNGDHIKTWRFNTIKAWNINWETKHMMIQLGDGKNVIFQCLSADCKVVHEFIGGYIFLSMRSKDTNQTLDEELFHKLTGGWQ